MINHLNSIFLSSSGNYVSHRSPSASDFYKIDETAITFQLFLGRRWQRMKSIRVLLTFDELLKIVKNTI